MKQSFVCQCRGKASEWTCVTIPSPSVKSSIKASFLSYSSTLISSTLTATWFPLSGSIKIEKINIQPVSQLNNCHLDCKSCEINMATATLVLQFSPLNPIKII